MSPAAVPAPRAPDSPATARPIELTGTGQRAGPARPSPLAYHGAAQEGSGTLRRAPATGWVVYGSVSARSKFGGESGGRGSPDGGGVLTYNVTALGSFRRLGSPAGDR